MTHRIAYYRVSTGDQSIEAQRTAMGGNFDQEFSDEGVSGATLAADRPGFAKLLSSIRKGDTVHVYAVDRLGRDALDVQGTVRRLIDGGVTVDVHGLGPIGKGVGEIILAVLAQIADMERNRIKERCDTGREAARAALAATGKTHKGKHGLGRKPVDQGPEIAAWRETNGASIAQTAAHFGVSTATVKRYCAEAEKRGRDERARREVAAHVDRRRLLEEETARLQKRPF
ncbi:recombinase family protein [Sphingobium fuliginis]|uniref:Recombinase family protein n=1 Tax=Sphingobium fuliginis ATCC 27551 TaxID=1208342 RepID=A0A5B8CDW7_SPHSA|nr:recombinase family protein [Sphingobium fuliginis]QDC36466.1 recombinase family protein [Sphingobium fuliginis ATCC 27551]